MLPKIGINILLIHTRLKNNTGNDIQKTFLTHILLILKNNSYIVAYKYNLIDNMKIQQIQALTNATVVCGKELPNQEVQCAFASDLMSDVLTLDCCDVLLVTGLCNMQTIRTAEMADVNCILFVRGKKITPAMLQVAGENNMILMETSQSMYHAVGELYSNGLLPVY